MNNLSKRVPVREQDPKQRIKNFDEVCLGYNDEEALLEASRCLDCKNPPCVTGCPVGVKIPAFIRKIKEGNVASAYGVIREDSCLPAVCGRVCPQESQCESKCVRGIKGDPIAIGKLERYCADKMATQKVIESQIASNGIKIAIIGSGPSGLACAGYLSKMGYQVTVFEALHEFGGVLTYGIPEFRLPKKTIVKNEILNLKSQGVNFEKNVVIGRSITIDELIENEGFSAIYVCSGAGLPIFMGIKGEGLNGVLSANEFLTRNNLMGAFREDTDTPILRKKRVVVVGGGNVAMDAARTAVRLGSEVHLVYRRGEAEIPARLEEVQNAKEEGVIFNLLTNPKEILGDEDGNVVGIKLVKTELCKSGDGRRKCVEVEGSEFEFPADLIIMAIGTNPNPLISKTTDGLDVDGRGRILVNGSSKTSKEGVFAGGDAVTGAATVIMAMRAGKQAAKEIDMYLKNK